MDKPDYGFWEKQPDYTLQEAANLCCDFEPEWGKPVPAKVSAMQRRIEQEVPYIRHNYASDKRYTREDLRRWAIQTEQRPNMPFLFPEDRAQDNTEGLQLRSDTKEGLLFLIGLLAHALVKRGGNALGTSDKPNQSGIVRELEQIAKELGADTHGLSPAQINDRLKDAFQEVRNRTIKPK